MKTKTKRDKVLYFFFILYTLVYFNMIAVAIVDRDWLSVVSNVVFLFAVVVVWSTRKVIRGQHSLIEEQQHLIHQLNETLMAVHRENTIEDLERLRKSTWS